jgi:hypothetical protein
VGQPAPCRRPHRLQQLCRQPAPALEEAKLVKLRDTISRAFNGTARIYRAGRYGVGPQRRHPGQASIAIDTSVRSHFDYSSQGGPDFTELPRTPGGWTGAAADGTAADHGLFGLLRAGPGCSRACGGCRACAALARPA